MKNRVLAAAAIAGLTVSLAACGSDNDSSSGSSSSSGTSATSGDAQAGFPATVSTKFGDVTITAKPKRVVALGWGDAETALELGVQPVGASDWLNLGGSGIGPWMKEKYDTKPTMIATQQPSYEQIAALKPDLILDTKGSGDQARYDKLKAIAPTVSVPKGGDTFLTTPTQQMNLVSTALGERPKGDALLKGLHDRFAQAAKANPSWKGRTMSALAKQSNGWSAYTKGSDRVTFMENLGFTQNPKIAAMKASAGFFTPLSAENLDDADADVVVAFPIFVKKEQLTGDTAWKNLPAVKKGHDVVIDGDLANAYSLGGVESTEYAIDKMVPQLKKAVAK